MSQYEILHVFQHMTKIHSIIFILNVVYIYTIVLAILHFKNSLPCDLNSDFLKNNLSFVFRE